jgi:hypothetical protein
VIDVKSRFLPGLGESAVLTAIRCTLSDTTLQSSGHVAGVHRRIWRSKPRSPQPQQGEEIDQLTQPFGFLAFLVAERLTAVLLVEQRLQSTSDALWHP